MRSNILHFILLAGASFSNFVAAAPTAVPTDIVDIEGASQSLNPEFSQFDARGLKVKYDKNPSHAAECPATNNGANRNYGKHDYSKGQIEAAFKSAASLAADGKTKGAQKYPHDFNNKEKLPFKCGKSKMEFPIQTNGKTYDGGSVDNVPDRVVFEYKKTKSDFIVKYCGVMRHGPTPAFINCKDK